MVSVRNSILDHFVRYHGFLVTYAYVNDIVNVATIGFIKHPSVNQDQNRKFSNY